MNKLVYYDHLTKETYLSKCQLYWSRSIEVVHLSSTCLECCTCTILTRLFGWSLQAISITFWWDFPIDRSKHLFWKKKKNKYFERKKHECDDGFKWTDQVLHYYFIWRLSPLTRHVIVCVSHASVCLSSRTAKQRRRRNNNTLLSKSKRLKQTSEDH